MSSHGLRWIIRSGLCALAILLCAGDLRAAQTANAESFAAELRPRLQRCLDHWCRWLSTYLYRVPGTDLYTLNPTLGTGNNPYRDVAGNQFAAAAAGYWLKRADSPEEIAVPLRGLIKLALGTHIAAKTIDRPDTQLWGATLSMADDWHADLFAVAQGMLLHNALPPDQNEQLLKILSWEADKQVEYGIDKKWRTLPGLWPQGSCGESNAWSATLLQMARLALPDSPRQWAWRRSAIEYVANSLCMPADLTSQKLLGGAMLKDLVKGANFEPGGIQEHHGFYHPGYEGWPLAYLAYAYVIDQQLPPAERDGEGYLHNWKYVYDRLKQATLSNGRFIHCAGDDWITYGYGNTQFMPAAIFAAAHFSDADGARMADEWIKLVEMQQDLGHGSVLAARLATFQRHRINDFSWYEGQEGCCLAQALWLLDHMDAGKLPQPTTADEFNKRNTATYYEPNVRLAWHRDEHRFAAVAWRAAFGQWQLMVQPVALPNLLKHNHNGMGLLEISGLSRSTKVESSHIGTFPEGGFWTIGCIGRESKNVIHGRPGNKVTPMVRQYQAFVAIPDGPTVLVDLCQAVDQLWLLREASLGLRLAADVFNEHAVNISTDGKEVAWSPAECEDTWEDLAARVVTIEKELHIQAIAGEGSFQLLRKRQRLEKGRAMLYASDPYGAEESLLSHELYFGPPAYQRPRIISPQEWFRRNALVLYCDPATTPRESAGTLRGEYPLLAVDLPGAKCSIGINFSDSSQSIALPKDSVELEPHSVRLIRWQASN